MPKKKKVRKPKRLKVKRRPKLRIHRPEIPVRSPHPPIVTQKQFDEAKKHLALTVDAVGITLRQLSACLNRMIEERELGTISSSR